MTEKMFVEYKKTHNSSEVSEYVKTHLSGMYLVDGKHPIPCMRLTGTSNSVKMLGIEKEENIPYTVIDENGDIWLVDRRHFRHCYMEKEEETVPFMKESDMNDINKRMREIYSIRKKMFNSKLKKNAN